MKRSSAILRCLLPESGRSPRSRRTTLRSTNERSDPRYLELLDRLNEGLRKAGMPET